MTDRRQIIQIVACQVQENYSTQCEMFLHALCNDGTVWRIDNRGDDWRPLPSIPQDEDAQPKPSWVKDLPTEIPCALWLVERHIGEAPVRILDAGSAARITRAIANEGREAFLVADQTSHGAGFTARKAMNNDADIECMTVGVGDEAITYIYDPIPF